MLHVAVIVTGVASNADRQRYLSCDVRLQIFCASIGIFEEAKICVVPSRSFRDHFAKMRPVMADTSGRVVELITCLPVEFMLVMNRVMAGMRALGMVIVIPEDVMSAANQDVVRIARCLDQSLVVIANRNNLQDL